MRSGYVRYVQGNQLRTTLSGDLSSSGGMIIVPARTKCLHGLYNSIYAIAIAIARTNIPLSSALHGPCFTPPPPQKKILRFELATYNIFLPANQNHNPVPAVQYTKLMLYFRVSYQYSNWNPKFGQVSGVFRAYL